MSEAAGKRLEVGLDPRTVEQLKGGRVAPAGASRVPPWVPADLRLRLDLSELAQLDASGEAERRRLEQELGAFVAAYLSQAGGAHPAGTVQLCSTFEAAPLRSEQFERLRAAEARVPGVVFVAYAAPLRRRRAGL